MIASPQQPYTLPSRSKVNRTIQNLSKSMFAPTLKNEIKIKNENTTICIVHSTLRDATTLYIERCMQDEKNALLKTQLITDFEKTHNQPRLTALHANNTNHYTYS